MIDDLDLLKSAWILRCLNGSITVFHYVATSGYQCTPFHELKTPFQEERADSNE